MTRMHGASELRGRPSPLQIALDATYSLSRNPSGVGVYSRELIAGLAAAHRQVDWLLCYRAHAFRRAWMESRGRPASRLCLLQESIGGLPPYRADLFHGLGQRLPKRKLRRAVATFHDLFVLTGEYSTPEFRERFALQAQQAADRADLVIAVSRFTRRAVCDLLGVETSRIRVIPHGFRFRTRPGAAPVQRDNLILNVGTIQKRKNIVALVRAFEHVGASWRLAIAGGKDGFGAAEALAAVENSSRRADITLLGYVPDEELAHLFARASVFAFPSLDEGFGIPVLEAMAAGVPVLTSSTSALPEVAGDATLLVNPLDQPDITAGLLRLTTDASLRADLVERGLARVRQFSWESAVEKTWAVYRELA